MGYQFHILDVFTDQPFGGNQLAVVERADDLDEGKMQAIAKEFGFSETVFLQTSQNNLASAKLRIFTPAQEISFAGHPTIGVAVLLGEQKMGDNEASPDALIMLEEQIGLVRCIVSMEKDAVSYAEFDAPCLPTKLTDVPEADLVADALGLGIMDIGFENHKICAVKAGNQFILVPLRNMAIVRQAEPDLKYWTAAFEKYGPVGVYVYCRGGIQPNSGFHARMFAPSLGVMEDAATGSAAVAFASVIKDFEVENQSMFETYIEQGYELGRPSCIKLEAEFEQQNLRAVRVGGHALHVATGELL